MNMLVARKLHERRYRPNPVMTTGELLNLIGSDGMQEALDRRWLVPDADTGFLTLNLHGGKLVELEAACHCESCGKTACDCGEKGEAGQLSTMPMREAFAAFGVTRPGGIGAAQQPTPTTPQGPTTPTPTTPTTPLPKTYRQGDPVMVEQDKTMYQGEVSGFEPDGRIRVRWRGARPPEDRAYGPGEFLVTDEKPHA
jgi:hypothetical protein